MARLELALARCRERSPMARKALGTAERVCGALGGPRGGGLELCLVPCEAHRHPLRGTELLQPARVARVCLAKLRRLVLLAMVVTHPAAPASSLEGVSILRVGTPSSEHIRAPARRGRGPREPTGSSAPEGRVLGGEAQLHTAKARALRLRVEGGEAAALPEGTDSACEACAMGAPSRLGAVPRPPRPEEPRAHGSREEAAQPLQLLGLLGGALLPARHVRSPRREDHAAQRSAEEGYGGTGGARARGALCRCVPPARQRVALARELGVLVGERRGKRDGHRFIPPVEKRSPAPALTEARLCLEHGGPALMAQREEAAPCAQQHTQQHKVAVADRSPPARLEGVGGEREPEPLAHDGALATALAHQARVLLAVRLHRHARQRAPRALQRRTPPPPIHRGTRDASARL